MGAGQTSERQIWTIGICIVKLGFIIDFADDVVHLRSLWTLALDQTSPGQTTKNIYSYVKPYILPLVFQFVLICFC